MSKTYFVTSDIHSYADQLFAALMDAGFDNCNPNHILVVCGDAFDRGNEAKKLLNFLLKLPKERLILIRGNHEDLLEDCLYQVENKVNISEHHWFNGTVDTIAQLTGYDKYDIICGVYDFKVVKRKLKKYLELISRAVDYFEIDKYIFVHGWIPCLSTSEYYYNDNVILNKNPDWRNASKEEWEYARWINGMKAWKDGVREDDKTIVCGHWHASFGNYNYHHIGSGEHTEDADFNPFIDNGIIALDSCVAFTNKMNVFKIEA